MGYGFAEFGSVSISYSSITNIGAVALPTVQAAPGCLLIQANFIGYGGSAFDETFTNVVFGMNVDSTGSYARSETISIPVLGSAHLSLCYMLNYTPTAGVHTVYLLGRVIDGAGPPITCNADVWARWV